MQEINMLDLHMHTWTFGGYTFGGFQGCVRYKENPQAIMFTQEEANAMFTSFPSVDIFISHCPSRGINDEEEIAHQRFNTLRDYVDKKHPKVLFYGHTYPTEENIVQQYNGTRIEFVSGYKIIDI